MIYNLNPQKTETTQIKIGVLGGTFDPPHLGHLKIAEAAIEKLSLAEVMFAPAGQPPHKDLEKISSVEDRVEMVRLAIAGNPRFTLSRIDVDRAGPAFTVETLRMLRASFSDEIEIYFLMGLDSLAAILTWRAPAEIIRLCRLAVFDRPGVKADLDALEKQLPGLRDRVEFVDSIALDISAHDIQRRMRAGESIHDFVPPLVAAYIARAKLYRA
ncbi:MAG: nicotinate-nucleotide adenylyltransferase [Chloroflexi bacterium]|nr:nicotinate-nucleotide adenylyltransferase [Chloroflexota bacterium]